MAEAEDIDTAEGAAPACAVVAASPPVPDLNASPLKQFFDNLGQGLRMALLLSPRREAINFSWGQMLALIGLSLLLGLGLQFAYVGRDGFLQTEVLAEYLLIAPEILLVWVLGLLARDSAGSAGSARYLIVLLSLGPPIILASPLLFFAYPMAENVWLQWLLYYFLPLWYALAAAVAAPRIFDMRGFRALLALVLVPTVLLLADRHLHSDRWLWSSRSELPIPVEADPAVRALLNEDNFYRQPQLLAAALDDLQPERPGQTDLYFIGAAGYAAEGVFMREVNSITALFNERFDTQGRSMRLINNVTTADEVPIFTSTALRRSLNRIGSLMNSDEDILFLFMTSHGSREHRFSLDFGAMSFKEIEPEGLRKLLDESGIKYRVIVVSACYSGGFVEALKDDNTLVITAAAADRNSFGCNNENDFTYFGKAYFDEALRKTYSFTEAFELAKPVIAAREKVDDYTPSEPQMALGKNISPVLEGYARAREQALQNNIKPQ